MTVTVSVGMPVYNAACWLRPAIESILAQTYADFELIISDNASTDDSSAICRDYASRESRIRYIRNTENVGANPNYNAVFRQAAGAYFKWASSNDICDPRFLERCVEVLEQQGDVVVCYPRTRLFNVEQGVFEEYEDNLHLMDEAAYMRFRRLLKNIRLNNVMNGVIRASVLRKTVLVNNYFSSDINMMAELALHGKFCEVPEPLYYRRMDAETATSLKGRDELIKHYYPGQAGKMLFQHWKLMLGQLAAVIRAPLAYRQKAMCYGHVLRRGAWARHDLLDDVRVAVRSSSCRARTVEYL